MKFFIFFLQKPIDFISVMSIIVYVRLIKLPATAGEGKVFTMKKQAIMERMQGYCYITIGQCIDVHYVWGGDDYYVGILPNSEIRYYVIDLEGNKTNLHKDEVLSPFESMILADMLDAYYNSVVA